MPEPTYLPPFPLYPHQEKALGEMHDRCVLRGGVGSGKTYTALVYYIRQEAPRDLVVITTARKRDELDWEADASQLGIGRDVSVPGRGTITVDSWNNIHKYIDRKDCFFIFDEQRLVGQGVWVKSFLKIARYNRWIMLSATPADTWMDYIPLFVANGFYKNRTEFIRQHVIFSRWSKYPKVERFIGTATLAKRRNQVLVDMPFARHTVRNLETVWCEYNRDIYRQIWRDRWNPYENRPAKDIQEVFRLIRQLINSDPSRLTAVLEAIDSHPKLIVFYNFNYERTLIHGLVQSLTKFESRKIPSTSMSTNPSSSITMAEWSGHIHQSIPKTDRWLYIVQYAAGAEAWNCIETDAMLFYSLTYSGKVFEQCQGRIDRINTPFKDLHYYILRSEAPVETGIWDSLMNKKDFNEKDFAKRSKDE